MFSSCFYNRLDPEYRQKLLKIEETFKLYSNKVISVEQYQEKASEFFGEFMMPKELWEKTFSLATDEYFFFLQSTNKLIAPSVYQFSTHCSKVTAQNNVINNKKLYDFKYTGCHCSDINFFCYPHKNLDKIFNDYERFHTYSLVPKCILRKLEKMKSLYLKIKSVKGDNEKWIKALMEAEDQQFVEDNVEHQLGQDLTNKKLWKLYLEYLNLNNQKKLLQTYSKYCRFFITDADMLEEYRKTAVGSQQKVFVPWKNPFNFEEFDENFFAEEILPNKLFPVFQKPPLKHHFNPKNALPQRFPFKPTLMHYILKTADANILQNLFKSCKYFYLSNPVTIIFKLKPYHGPANGIQIREQSINLQICSTIPAWLGKLFISTILDLSSNMFNNFLPRLYRCTAKYVSLSQLNLSDKEMDILIGHGNVVDLHLWEIKDENDKFLILENVLKMVPKIINLVVNCVRCTTKTAEILCQLPFKNKMENFGLTDVQDTALEPKDFAKFITKNFCSKGEAIFEFSYFDGRAAYSKNFREAVNAGIDESWNGKENDKPTFKFT